MLFVVLFIKLGSVSCDILYSHDLKPIDPARVSHLAIEELQYHQVKEKGNNETPLQITDNFDLKFSYTPSFLFHYSINLYIYGSEENTWEEASVKESIGESQCGWHDRYRYHFTCYRSVKLSKPLIGYDMLKPSGCGEGEFKKQPYTYKRWGYEELGEENETECYMVLVSTRSQSVSRLYPDNCVKQMQSTEEYAIVKRGKRSTLNYDVIDFEIKGKKNIKFICKFEILQYGSFVNLQHNIPNTEVKVYYKENDSDPWGYLLDLDWKSFSSGSGYNKYKSVVSREHLATQGVDVNGCFKCEGTVTHHGIVRNSRLGDCDCS